MHFDIVTTNTTGNVTNSTSSEECKGESIPVNIPFVESISGIWVVWSIALFFVLLSWVISFYLIYKHLKYYTQPEHQRYIVRLLCMVPLYGLYSVLSLIFHRHQIYFAIARDCYEAYALFMFFKLCVSYGGGKEAIVDHFNSLPKMKLTFPLNFWKVQPSELFYTVCKQGMLQYVLIRPVVSIWAAILQVFGAYGDGSLATDMGYFYAFVINNFCVMIALYIVVLFEQAAKELLHPYRPILKFLSVKMVIFLAFWQSIVIAYMAHMDWIPRFNCLPAADVATGLQNFLMCFEMCFVALLHIIAYPYELYRVRALTNAPISSSMKTSVLKNMVNMMNQADLLKDTIESLNIQRTKKDKGEKGEKGEKGAEREGGIERGHIHPFGMVPVPQQGAASAFLPQGLSHAGSSSSSSSKGVRFRDEYDSDEDGGGLLAHASSEPLSAAPSAIVPSSDEDYPPPHSPPDAELNLISSPVAPSAPTLTPTPAPVPFSQLRQRNQSLALEMDDLVDDDLLDELDDEDLDYETFRR